MAQSHPYKPKHKTKRKLESLYLTLVPAGLFVALVVIGELSVVLVGVGGVSVVLVAAGGLGVALQGE